jgi:hypothetical protein
MNKNSQTARIVEGGDTFFHAFFSFNVPSMRPDLLFGGKTMLWLKFISFQARHFILPPWHMPKHYRPLYIVQQLLVLPFRVVRLFAWSWRVSSGPMVKLDRPEKCCVVLLSYKRAPNMEMLVRSLLKCDFVGKIVVCNNNPEFDLRQMMRFDDPRVHLVQREEPTRQGIRFSLAKAEAVEYKYFISPDDDRFLYPNQIKKLFLGLLEDPSVPHGFEGEDQDREDFRRFHVALTGERRVDHLTGYYLFTREQLFRVLGIFEALGWNDLTKVGNGEDVALSFSGTERPRIHKIGRVLDCETWKLPGVATWATHKDFYKERVELHIKLEEWRSNGFRILDKKPNEAMTG